MFIIFFLVVFVLSLAVGAGADLLLGLLPETLWVQGFWLTGVMFAGAIGFFSHLVMVEPGEDGGILANLMMVWFPANAGFLYVFDVSGIFMGEPGAVIQLPHGLPAVYWVGLVFLIANLFGVVHCVLHRAMAEAGMLARRRKKT